MVIVTFGVERQRVNESGLGLGLQLHAAFRVRFKSKNSRKLATRSRYRVRGDELMLLPWIWCRNCRCSKIRVRVWVPPCRWFPLAVGDTPARGVRVMRWGGRRVMRGG